MKPTPIINPTSFPVSRFANIGGVLGVLVPLMYIGAAALLALMLIKAAYLMVTAGGDSEQVDKAKQTATFAFFGILVVIVSTIVMKLLGYFTGISIPFL